MCGCHPHDPGSNPGQGAYLNACYSEEQGTAIAEYIDCVIGVPKAIGDSTAIEFAKSFYQAIGYGRNVKEAYDLGCNQIDLANLDEENKPKLICNNCDPKDIIFIRNIQATHDREIEE